MAGKPLKVGVVGATGMVGKVFMQMLDQRTFPIAELRPFASDASLGKKIFVRGQEWGVQVLKPGCFDGLDLVFFSSGDEISKEWAPLAAKSGAIAIDNSAAFRMDAAIPLVVPEVNGELLTQGMKPGIIANPNCSTIQLVVALKALKKFGLKEVRVSSYQAVSGAGQAGHDELLLQTVNFENENLKPSAFPHVILFNAIPQIGSFNGDGFCSEEVKIMNETRKILGLPSLKISAFTVRIPALNAHSESVWVELDQDVRREEILSAFREGEGLVLQDDPMSSVYPTARQVSGKDPVYVGRVHRDPENPRLWLMWIVSDNIRKGAALNGLQIAERIFDISRTA